MSDNFGSKFAALILAVITIALSASSYHAASAGHISYDGYDYNPAAESHHDSGSYDEKANADYTADGNKYSYNNYHDAKNADYYAYLEHSNAKYDAADYKYTAYQRAHVYGRADYELDYTADYLHYSRFEAPGYKNIRYEDNLYQEGYV